MKSEELVPVRREIGIRAPSRFRDHDVYVTDTFDNEYYETWNIPDFPSGPGDKFHSVQPGEEGIRGAALLAYTYYRRPDLWWIIASANGIFNATRDLKAGITLRIPAREAILKLLL